jgi:hypothetical protein
MMTLLKILLASWRGTRFEVSQVLREVCDKVLKDPEATEDVLLKRAKVRAHRQQTQSVQGSADSQPNQGHSDNRRRIQVYTGGRIDRGAERARTVSRCHLCWVFHHLIVGMRPTVLWHGLLERGKSKRRNILHTGPTAHRPQVPLLLQRPLLRLQRHQWRKPRSRNQGNRGSIARPLRASHIPSHIPVFYVMYLTILHSNNHYPWSSARFGPLQRSNTIGIRSPIIVK